MDQLNHIGVEVETLKAVVLGLVSVIQEDRQALEKAKTTALGHVRGWGDPKTLDLIQKHVVAILTPKLYTGPVEG
ncbi:hypothetical protein D3C79_1015160 [compost metagenome]|jgi:hypothetical protein